MRLGLGIFSPKKPNRTEPTRTEPNYWFFGFFGSASVWIFRKFGHRVRVRFLACTEPNSRTTEIINSRAPKISQCSPPRPMAHEPCAIYTCLPTLNLTLSLLPTPRTDQPAAGGRSAPVPASASRGALNPQALRTPPEHKAGGARQCGAGARGRAARAHGAVADRRRQRWRAGARQRAAARSGHRVQRRAGRAAGASQAAAHSRSSGRRRVRATCLLLRLQDCLHPYLALLACCTCACYMQFASIASCFRAAVCLIVADFLAEQICTGC